MHLGTRVVRETGGNNAHRIVMIATNSWGNHNQIFPIYPDRAALPGGGEDPYLAIQVHSYDPWEFCGENGDNSAYPGDAATASRMREVAAHGRSLGVPIHYGEFGVGRNGNQAQRNSDLVRGYYRTVVQTAMDEDMATSVWDDQGWFGLITGDARNGYSFIFGIVPHMLAD
jgi:endoglucanase